MEHFRQAGHRLLKFWLQQGVLGRFSVRFRIDIGGNRPAALEQHIAFDRTGVSHSVTWGWGISDFDCKPSVLQELAFVMGEPKGNLGC